MKPPLLHDHRLLTPLNRGQWLTVLACAVFFVLVCAFWVMGQYQSHSGDMGQYITHARNLVWGRAWEQYMVDFPAVLPGYSLLIALPVTMIGLNMWVLGMMNAAMWGAFAVAAFAFYYRKENAALCWILLAVVLFNPAVIAFAQEAQPNIFYAMSVSVALYAGYRLQILSFARHKGQYLGLVLLVLLPACIRQDSLALYMALMLYYLLTRRHLMLLACAGIALTLALDLLITSFGQLSNISVLFYVGMKYADPSVHEASEAHFAASFAYMLLTYMHTLTEMLLPRSILPDWLAVQIPVGSDYVLNTTWPRIALTGIFSLGFLRGRSFFAADKLFFGGHIVMLSLFLLVDGTHFRYLLPVLAIYIYYLLQGGWLLLQWMRIDTRAARSIALATVLTVTLWAAQANHSQPRRSNTMFTNNMHSMVSWIKNHNEGAGIAYFKNRLLLVLLDDTPPSTTAPDPKLTVSRLRESWQLDKYMQIPGYLLVVNKQAWAAKPNYFLPLLNADLRVERVYDDASHSIFRVRGTAKTAKALAPAAANR